MLVDEVDGEDVFHVASIEERVVDAVDCRIDLCVLDCLWHIFDAHHLASLTRHEVGNGACACVEVIDERLLIGRSPIRSKSCKSACVLIELVGLL